jgi:hypothetical protein
MKIAEVNVKPNWTLLIKTTEGAIGLFDVQPYLCYEAFGRLSDPSEFIKISNGGYFVEWQCGADLSADTIEAKMQPVTA